MSLTLTRRYNVDRFGYLIPHRYGNLPMLGAVATFRPGEGRFGRGAVAVEEGTVNLCAESSYSAYATTNLGLVTMDTPHGRQEVFEFALSSGFSTARAHKSFSIEAGKTYTVSFVAKAEKPYARMSIGSIKFWPEGGATADYTLGPILSKELGNGWTYFSQSVSISSTNRNSMSLMAVMSDALPGDKAWVYNFQAEEKPFATSFVAGTRAAGRLVYPPNTFNPTEFTFAAWWKPVIDIPSGFSRIFQLDDGTASSVGRWLALRRTQGSKAIGLAGPNASGTSDVLYVEVTDNYDPNEWQFVACRRSGRDVYVRLNDKVAEATLGFDPAPFNIVRFNIGSAGVDRLVLNGLIDELLILPYAASEEEILAWYEADGPIPSHPDALLQWDWQAVRPATMVAL